VKSLQEVIDSQAGKQEIRIVPGVYLGPVALTRSMKVHAVGVSVLSDASPVVLIDAQDVHISGLRIVATGARENGFQAQSSAIEIRCDHGLILRDVCLEGGVEGLEREVGQWLLPSGIEVNLPAGAAAQVRFQVSVPVPTWVNSEFITVELPNGKLAPGIHEICIRFPPLASGTLISGSVFIDTNHFRRVVVVSGRAVDSNPSVSLASNGSALTSGRSPATLRGTDSLRKSSAAISEFDGWLWLKPENLIAAAKSGEIGARLSEFGLITEAQWLARLIDEFGETPDDLLSGLRLLLAPSRLVEMEDSVTSLENFWETWRQLLVEAVEEQESALATVERIHDKNRLHLFAIAGCSQRLEALNMAWQRAVSEYFLHKSSPASTSKVERRLIISRLARLVFDDAHRRLASTETSLGEFADLSPAQLLSALKSLQGGKNG
jgi:hypothetical protein